MRLDHLSSVGPPGSRNTVVQAHASGPTARKWSNRTQVVQPHASGPTEHKWSKQENTAMNPPPPFTGRRTPSTPRAPRESPPHQETRPASSPLLRPFPFTTPLHPLLYEKKERSGGRKGAAERKGRSRRLGGPPADPRNRWAGVPRRHRWHHAERLTRNGAGGAPGTVLRWGRVQICCKGAPGRDRPREEARNINVSSRASARSGPLQQIWTTGAARAPRRGRQP